MQNGKLGVQIVHTVGLKSLQLDFLGLVPSGLPWSFTRTLALICLQSQILLSQNVLTVVIKLWRRDVAEWAEVRVKWMGPFGKVLYLKIWHTEGRRRHEQGNRSWNRLGILEDSSFINLSIIYWMLAEFLCWTHMVNEIDSLSSRC